MAERGFPGEFHRPQRYEPQQVQALVDQHLTATDADFMAYAIKTAYVASPYRKGDPKTLVFFATTLLDQSMHEGPAEEESHLGQLRAEVGDKLRALKEVPDGLGEHAYRAVVEHVLGKVADSLFFFMPARKAEVLYFVRLQGFAQSDLI